MRLTSRQPRMEQAEHSRLFGLKLGQVTGKLMLGLAFERGEHGPIEIGINDLGMDIALPADGRRVPQSLGDALDGTDHVLLGLGRRVKRLELAEGQGGEDGAGPGPEVLGGEVLSQRPRGGRRSRRPSRPSGDRPRRRGTGRGSGRAGRGNVLTTLASRAYRRGRSRG